MKLIIEIAGWRTYEMLKTRHVKVRVVTIIAITMTKVKSHHGIVKNKSFALCFVTKHIKIPHHDPFFYIQIKILYNSPSFKKATRNAF